MKIKKYSTTIARRRPHSVLVYLSTGFACHMVEILPRDGVIWWVMSLRAVSVRVWELSGVETCHQHVCLCMSDIYLADVFMAWFLCYNILNQRSPAGIITHCSMLIYWLYWLIVNSYTYERLASHSLIFCISFRQGICLQCSHKLIIIKIV